MSLARVAAHGAGPAPRRLWEAVAAVHLLNSHRRDPVELRVSADSLAAVRHPVEELGMPVQFGDSPPVHGHGVDVVITTHHDRLSVQTSTATADLPASDGPSVLAELLALLLDGTASR